MQFYPKVHYNKIIFSVLCSCSKLKLNEIYTKRTSIQRKFYSRPHDEFSAAHYCSFFERVFLSKLKRDNFFNHKNSVKKGQLRFVTSREVKKHRSSPKIDFPYHGTFLINSFSYARQNFIVKEKNCNWGKAFLFYRVLSQRCIILDYEDQFFLSCTCSRDQQAVLFRGQQLQVPKEFEIY